MTVLAIYKDLLEYALSFVPVQGIGRATLVCRAWNDAIQKQSFWERLSKKCPPCSLILTDTCMQGIPQGNRLTVLKTVVISYTLSCRNDEEASNLAAVDLSLVLLQRNSFRKELIEHLVKNEVYGLADEIYSCNKALLPPKEVPNYSSLITLADSDTEQGVRSFCKLLDARRGFTQHSENKPFNFLESLAIRIATKLHDLSLNEADKRTALVKIASLGRSVENMPIGGCWGHITGECTEIHHTLETSAEPFKDLLMHELRPSKPQGRLPVLSIIEKADLIFNRSGYLPRELLFDWFKDNMPADFKPGLPDDERGHEFLASIHDDGYKYIRISSLIYMLLSLGIIEKKS